MPKMFKLLLLAVLGMSLTVGCDKMRKMNPFKKKPAAETTTTAEAPTATSDTKSEPAMNDKPVSGDAVVKKPKKKGPCSRKADEQGLKMGSAERKTFMSDCTKKKPAKKKAAAEKKEEGKEGK